MRRSGRPEPVGHDGDVPTMHRSLHEPDASVWTTRSPNWRRRHEFSTGVWAGWSPSAGRRGGRGLAARLEAYYLSARRHGPDPVHVLRVHAACVRGTARTDPRSLAGSGRTGGGAQVRGRRRCLGPDQRASIASPAHVCPRDRTATPRRRRHSPSGCDGRTPAPGPRTRLTEAAAAAGAATARLTTVPRGGLRGREHFVERRPRARATTSASARTRSGIGRRTWWRPSRRGSGTGHRG
jgi:hypothetical protein